MSLNVWKDVIQLCLRGCSGCSGCCSGCSGCFRSSFLCHLCFSLKPQHQWCAIRSVWQQKRWQFHEWHWANPKSEKIEMCTNINTSFVNANLPLPWQSLQVPLPQWSTSQFPHINLGLETAQSESLPISGLPLVILSLLLHFAEAGCSQKLLLLSKILTSATIGFGFGMSVGQSVGQIETWSSCSFGCQDKDPVLSSEAQSAATAEYNHT